MSAPIFPPGFSDIPVYEILERTAPKWSKERYIQTLQNPDLKPDDALRLLKAAYCMSRFYGLRPAFGAYLRDNPAWTLWLLEDPAFPQKCATQLRMTGALDEAQEFTDYRASVVGGRFTPPPALSALLAEASLDALAALAIDRAERSLGEIEDAYTTREIDDDSYKAATENRWEGMRLAAKDRLPGKYPVRIGDDGFSVFTEVHLSTSLFDGWEPWTPTPRVTPDRVCIWLLPASKIAAGNACVRFEGELLELPHGFVRREPHLSTVTYEFSRARLLQILPHETIHIAQFALSRSKNLPRPEDQEPGTPSAGLGPMPHKGAVITYLREPWEFYSYLNDEIRRFHKKGGDPIVFIKQSVFFVGLEGEANLWKRAAREFYRAVTEEKGLVGAQGNPWQDVQRSVASALRAALVHDGAIPDAPTTVYGWLEGDPANPPGIPGQGLRCSTLNVVAMAMDLSHHGEPPHPPPLDAVVAAIASVNNIDGTTPRGMEAREYIRARLQLAQLGSPFATIDFVGARLPQDLWEMVQAAQTGQSSEYLLREKHCLAAQDAYARCIDFCARFNLPYSSIRVEAAGAIDPDWSRVKWTFWGTVLLFDGAVWTAEYQPKRHPFAREKYALGHTYVSAWIWVDADAIDFEDQTEALKQASAVLRRAEAQGQPPVSDMPFPDVLRIDRHRMSWEGQVEDVYKGYALWVFHKNYPIQL